MKPKIITLKKFIYFVFIALLLVLMGYSIYKIAYINEEAKNSISDNKIELSDIDYKEEDKKEEPETKPTEKETASKLFSNDADLKAYREKYKNNDIVARLEIPDLFDILITKTTDNKFYLNHAIDRKKDKKGTEFLDYRTDPTAKQVNIYGHNSRTYDIPFRKLEKFLDKDFFESHPYILLQHDSGRRIYKIISIKEVTTDNEHMNVSASLENHIEHIDILKANSIYTRDDAYDENTNILTMQTCSYSGEKTYYVITAIELK